jgi:hypothetical protein
MTLWTTTFHIPQLYYLHILSICNTILYLQIGFLFSLSTNPRNLSQLSTLGSYIRESSPDIPHALHLLWPIAASSSNPYCQYLSPPPPPSCHVPFGCRPWFWRWACAAIHKKEHDQIPNWVSPSPLHRHATLIATLLTARQVTNPAMTPPRIAASNKGSTE